MFKSLTLMEANKIHFSKRLPLLKTYVDKQLGTEEIEELAFMKVPLPMLLTKFQIQPERSTTTSSLI